MVGSREDNEKLTVFAYPGGEFIIISGMRITILKKPLPIKKILTVISLLIHVLIVVLYIGNCTLFV